MTNTEFLDLLDAHTAFETFQTSSSEEGFTFRLPVTGDEFLLIMRVLSRFVGDRADFRISYDNRSGSEFGFIEVDTKEIVQLQELGRALVGAYVKINANG